MPHVLVGGHIQPCGIAMLDAAPGVTFDYLQEVSEESVAALIHKADALVVRTQPLTEATLARAERLRIVSRHGVGFDSVDVEALNRRGIALAVVGDVNSRSVAEHAVMMILAAAKRLVIADQAVRTGDWAWRNLFAPVELWRKTLLVVGYGRIGRHVAQIGQGFGMRVLAHDPFLAAEAWPEGAVDRADDLAAALPLADAIAICTPKSGGALIGAGELAAMKPTAVIVNTSRGGLIDEAALAEALHAGRIAGAGLDVFDDEPLPGGSPLLGAPRLILSPHVAGLSHECSERMATESVRNVLDFFAGRVDPALVVNRAAVGLG